MQEVDIVIISFAKSAEFKKTTEDCVKSLFSSEESIKFNVFIIESNPNEKYLDLSKQFKIRVVNPVVPFGYHRYLNIGIDLGNAEYVCLCNNDLIFNKNWASLIISEMEKDKSLLSASPFSSIPHNTIFKLTSSNSLDYGYTIRRHIAGWCIFQRREIYKLIGKLDERFTFWYADNDYAETIKRKGIKHALIKKANVEHIESKTLKSESAEQQYLLTRAQAQVFEKKWNIKI